ncbi:MAG TPA: DUF2892 domain-containing protein [Parvularcula sp.]|nr:DUF2892 domain-containing protein [Parvularcula sp.]
MKANMGMLDRVLRVLVAAGIAYFYFTGKIDGPLGAGLLVLAGVFVLTSLIGTCPLYLPFGISTRKAKGA